MPSHAAKRLIVNADDFGFSSDVNAGIVEAHRSGILTATTLMANGDAFGDAVRLARETPELDIGCHLVLISGNSLATGRPLPATTREFLTALAQRQIRPYDELKPQVEKILASGIEPTHLDTHKHTHLAPPVLDAVARLGEEYGIRWVRRPFDLPLSGGGHVPLFVRLVSRSMNGLRRHFHRVLSRRGCRTTDYFAGFQITGRFRSAELVSLIRALPEGLTEFMTHPGRCTEELERRKTRLKLSREDELAALVDPEVRTALRQSGVQLVRYRDLD
ncbi:MAG TPA: ChbG/HpnK family deacetylase [Bryobacteraceae bacterium]|nr:ChbG/HpnK family deacetylase [Bryobacteraceae bacterium]